MGRNTDKKKVEFQISPEMYERLRALAEKEDRSIASLVRLTLARELSKDGEEDGNGGGGSRGNERRKTS